MKTQDSINFVIEAIEKTLIIDFRPSFLHITTPDYDNDIMIIISTRVFINKPVHERIQAIFESITKFQPYILNTSLVVIRALTPNEMEEILNYVFDDLK